MIAAGSWAASWDPGAVAVLLKNGAAVDAQDRSGRTALMYAAEKGQLESARALLAHKADARLKDRKGKTARDHAKDPVLAARAPGLLTEKRLRELQRQERDDGRELRRLLEAARQKR
jgi:ankyrin repeat protein